MADNQGIAKLDLERKGGIGEVDDVIASLEKLRTDAFEEFRKDKENVKKYLEGLDKYARDNGGMGLKVNGQYNMDAIAQTIYLIQGQHAHVTKNLKEKIKELRRKIEEQERFKAQFGYDEQYEKWKKAQRTGRTPKKIDWERYDHMVSAGLPQKDILKYLDISGNTLRKKLKDREAQKDR